MLSNQIQLLTTTQTTLTSVDDTQAMDIFSYDIL